ncbi:MAG: DUF2892 domain-containing protein [Bacteroidetes bacterium]|nr:DUF2892 domain-containing protein [Bacteroidota bacterium]
MKKNVGQTDKILRTLAAVVLFYLAHQVVTETPWNYVLYIFGVVFVLVAIFGFCPLYSVFKMDTTEKKEE